MAGFDPAGQVKAFTPYMPILNVNAAYPPTLFLHGDQDTDVPYAQSVRMARRLGEAGVENKMVTLRGAGHEFQGANPEDLAAARREIVAFLARHVMNAGERP
ncbi:MAG: prolyl oligopeptidase family serine peptidase [bacterium]|nr:prolyl oligopeptidase family serine peptidase [bacterium]